MNKKKDIKLALETGVLGGSLCILSSNKEIAYWEGSAEVSKSEDVLQAIESLFKENLIEKGWIEEIIISVKPGSLTGLRIGRSIALGLKNAFNANVKEASLLEQILKLSNTADKFLAAIPAGRNKYSWMNSEKTIQSNILSGDIDLLKEYITINKIEKVFFHSNLINEFKSGFNVEIEDIGNNMAKYLHEGV